MGQKAEKEYFTGQYYKHQKGDKTLSVIAGQTRREGFIQVITDEASVRVPFEKGNHFSNQGIVLQVRSPGLTVSGEIRYGALSPIAYDIMGPFRFFPMECRHGVVSMRHRLFGSMIVNGERWDFNGGTGYMEMDSGRSFPSEYTWIQANDFPGKASIMAAAAEIPFCGVRFKGCICIIQYGGREYRLATYLGARVVLCTAKQIVLVQGPYRLEIRVGVHKGRCLAAPQDGRMSRTVREAVSCPAEFRFYIRGKQQFHFFSESASFESDKVRR